MSQHPAPPPGPPPPGSPPYAGGPPPSRRRRPAGWWFLVPVGLMLIGVVLVVVGFVTTLGPLSDEDAVVPADGAAQSVSLDDAGARVLMAPEGEPSPDCEARDVAGEPVDVGPVDASYSYSDGSGSWEGFAEVAEAGDELELTCSGGSEVRVIPSIGGLGGIFSGLGMIFGGVALGGIGFVILVILVILYAIGAPRRTTATG